MRIDEIRFTLKDGREALLRSPRAEDAEDMLTYLTDTARETPFLLRDPADGAVCTLEEERVFLSRIEASPDSAMLLCRVDGQLAGNCQISFNSRVKTRHRAQVAIALRRAYWDQGIGTRMLRELIRLAEERGDVSQLELEYVEGNDRARALYEKVGFRFTGIRPDSIRLPDGTRLAEHSMVLSLPAPAPATGHGGRVFRQLLRKKQALTREECLELLQQELRGVLSVLGDGAYPYGVPMDHYYCPEDGRLYFHSGMSGHKLDALRRHPMAGYCVYDKGRQEEGDWALHFRSVVVFGRVEFVEDRERIYELCRRLSLRFTRDEAYIQDEIQRAGPRTALFALIPEHISGKRVKES